MRFDLPISYNGITTGLTTRAGGLPDRGIEITRLRYGDVQSDGYLDKRALQDGLDAADVFLSGRQVLIDAAVYGSSDGDLWDQVQDFNRAFNPHVAYDADSANAGFLPFNFYQATADISTWPESTFPNGIPLLMYLRPLRTPSFVIEKNATGGGGVSGLGAKQLLTVPLIARDPRKYVQTERTAFILSSVGTAQYRGDYMSHPIVTWSQTAAGSSTFQLYIAGSSATIDLSSVTTGSFTLDYAKQTLVDGNGTNRNGLISDITEWAEMSDGNSTYQRVNATGIAGANPLLSYREAFT